MVTELNVTQLLTKLSKHEDADGRDAVLHKNETLLIVAKVDTHKNQSSSFY